MSARGISLAKQAAMLLAAVCAASVAAETGERVALGSNPAPAAAFAFKDTPGDHLDILIDGRAVARYMYAFDRSSPERLHETYKPYLHVLDPADGTPITKGPGGKYSHHRGIFVGFKINVAGKGTYDFWHIARDLPYAKKHVGKPIHLMLHREFVRREAGPDRASFTSVIEWVDPNGKPLVEEHRTLTFTRAPAPAIVRIELVTTLKAVAGDTKFGGDPEHAGCQYRPHNDVAENQSAAYVFPEERITTQNVKKERDLPWAALTYTLRGQTYAVQHMNHPSNPKGTVYSAYRDYGRFGAFPTFEVPKGGTQRLHYAFVIWKDKLPPRETLQEYYEAFAKE